MDTILFELNEVPFKVLDAYLSVRPESNLAQLVSASHQFVTICEDEVELDPWISWPTLHRGVNDSHHGILHLGQMLDRVDETYPPIWRLLKTAGLKVGVFGSVHSNHVPQDAEDYAFYVPDFFDDRVFAHPKWLQSFQRFNLNMTRRSARNVDRGVPAEDLRDFLNAVPQLGIAPSTIHALASQLLRERFNPTSRIRRRYLQSLLMNDVFVQLLRRERPNFSSFYTNHVAAAMHRYWAATFPQDYDSPVMPTEWNEIYSQEIWSALDILDLMLSKLRKFADRSQCRLVIASSMGQHAVQHQPTKGFSGLMDVEKFMSALGIEPNQYRRRHAMVPCHGVVVPPELMAMVTEKLDQVRVDDHAFVRSDKEITPMSYGVYEGGFIALYTYFENYQGAHEIVIGNTILPFEAAGWGMTAHEDGVSVTAHHSPEGLLLVYTPGEPPAIPGDRPTVSTLEIAPALLQSFGLTPPSYMTPINQRLVAALWSSVPSAPLKANPALVTSAV